MKTIVKILMVVIPVLAIYPGSFFSYLFLRSSFDPGWTSRLYEKIEKLPSDDVMKKLYSIDPFGPHPAIAMEVLAARKEKKAVPELIKYTKSKIKYRRSKAIWALGEIGDKRAVEPLVEIISKGENSRDCFDAKRALGKIEGKISSDLGE